MARIQINIVEGTTDSLAKHPHSIITPPGHSPADHFRNSVGTPRLRLQTIDTTTIQAIGPEEHSHGGKIYTARLMLAINDIPTELNAVFREGMKRETLADKISKAGGCRLVKLESSEGTPYVNFDAMKPVKEGGVESAALFLFRRNKSWINFRAGNTLLCPLPVQKVLAVLPSDDSPQPK